MGEYGLGIDLGTRYTAAAITAGGAVEAVRLGKRRAEIPSLVFRRADGEVLIGQAAREHGEPSLTDPELTGHFLRQVVARAARGRAGELDHVVLTHPARWAADDLEALREAARLGGLPATTLVSEPAAAAARARPGEIVAVYDLGGGFEATLLRRTADGAEILAAERVTGVDFDRMVFDHVREGLDLSDLDLARLRRACAKAVERLSSDAATEIAVPGRPAPVRLRRSELEELVGPTLRATVAALQRSCEAASVRPSDVDAVVLAGRAARMPLVGALVSAAIGRAVPSGEQPELAVAIGAAQLGADRMSPALSPASPASPADLTEPLTESIELLTIQLGSIPVGEAEPDSSDFPPSLAALMEPATTSARPALRVATPPRPRVARRRGRIWTYRWPIVIGLAGVLVAAGVTIAAARTQPPAALPPPASSASSSTPVTLLWTVATGLGSTEPPAVTGDQIVLGTADGQVRGYRRDDGRLSWSVAVGPSAWVATGVPGGRAYAATGDGKLVAIDTATGEIAWHRTTPTRFDSRPAVGDGRVFAGGRDGVLYAYDLAGRHSRWRVWADDPISRTPVLVGTVAVLAADDGRLYGTDHDGNPMWQPSVGPPAANPVAAAGAACLLVRDGTVRCARAADGALLPRIAPAGIKLGALAGGAGLVFATGADGSVGAWDPVSGTARWTYRPPADPGGAGHLLMRTGEIDIAYPDGLLVGLDARTGAELWHYATGDHLAAAPGGDDHGIYVLGASGLLYALRPPGVAAALGSSPTVAPTPTYVTRPAPTHRPVSSPTVGISTSEEPSSDPPSDPPSSDPPVSDPPSDPGPALHDPA